MCMVEVYAISTLLGMKQSIYSNSPFYKSWHFIIFMSILTRYVGFIENQTRNAGDSVMWDVLYVEMIHVNCLTSLNQTCILIFEYLLLIKVSKGHKLKFGTV